MAELSTEQKANALFSISTSAGLKVVLEIAESIALDSETILLETEPWSKEKEGRHAVAYAQREMYKKLVKTIDYMVSSRDTQIPMPSQPSLEERAEEAAAPVISMQ